jgi:glyoxylate carboligase
MFNKEFWKAVAERGVKTLAQSAAATLIAAGTGIINTDWAGVVSVAGMAAVISVLTSIGSGAITDGSPSLSSAEVLPTQQYENYPEEKAELDPQLSDFSEDPTDADQPETDVAEEDGM